MEPTSYQSIPDDVLDRIVAHRPHLATLVNNARNATSAGGARQIEKVIADNYLAGETHLSGLETLHLAACCRGQRYGEDSSEPAEYLNLRVASRTKESLRRIAGELGIVATQGRYTGEPSISEMVDMIAGGELTVTRPRPARQLWQHVTSGERYVVEIQSGRVVEAAGPLHHGEIEAVMAGDFNCDPELAEDIDGDQGSYRLAE